MLNTKTEHEIDVGGLSIVHSGLGSVLGIYQTIKVKVFCECFQFLLRLEKSYVICGDIFCMQAPAWW